MTNKHPYLAGWRLTEITRDNNEMNKVRENISVELSHLKNMPHGPLTETLTPMYVAGFMDGFFDILCNWLEAEYPAEVP